MSNTYIVRKVPTPGGMAYRAFWTHDHSPLYVGAWSLDTVQQKVQALYPKASFLVGSQVDPMPLGESPF